MTGAEAESRSIDDKRMLQKMMVDTTTTATALNSMATVVAGMTKSSMLKREQKITSPKTTMRLA